MSNTEWTWLDVFMHICAHIYAIYVTIIKEEIQNFKGSGERDIRN